MRADLAELMDAGETTHDHPVAEFHMAAERREIREHHLVADDAVVRDVCVRHEEIVVADARDAVALHGAAMHGREFADLIAIADLEARRLPLVLLVLRRIAER